MTLENRYISSLVGGLYDGDPFLAPEGLERERGRKFAARLGANENGFGASVRAVEAMKRAAYETWMYGDPDSYELIQAIADHHSVAVENVIVGEGIDGLLGLAVKATVNLGETVVTSNGAYPTFNRHVACHGGRLLKVSYRDDFEDLQALRDAAKVERAKVVYISNPDNPMGSTWRARDLERFETELYSGSVLLLDEAYCECAPPGCVPSLEPDNPRVIRFRTFSKAYGLAGARIGYAIAERGLVSAMDKVRNQYGINRVAQAGALAAILDQEHLKDVVGKIDCARERLYAIALDNGLRPLKSGGNFVTVDCGVDGVFANRVMNEILKRDVFIRMPGVAPLNRCIRVSVGPDRDLDIFEGVLGEALVAARAG